LGVVGPLAEVKSVIPVWPPSRYTSSGVATNRLQRSLRATFLGLAVNGLLAAGKLTAGIFGRSHALIADAVESMADIFSSIIVWRGVVLAAQPADANHPYGHGKAEPLAAAIVATMLLFAAVGIGLQAVVDVLQPKRGPEPFTLAVLVVVVVIKEALFRFVRREADTVESTAIRTDAWHHRSDVITSIAAGIGISVALVGGDPWALADDIAAVVAAGIIAWNGWRLLRPALDELMDASPSRALVDQIRAAAATTGGVDRVEKCVVRKMGYQYFVDMHVEVDPDMSVMRAHRISHEVRDTVRQRIAAVRDVLVHIEPRGHGEEGE
jgi:cation diffusion facilitator family transporter